jgi:hypothetical protein
VRAFHKTLGKFLNFKTLLLPAAFGLSWFGLYLVTGSICWFQATFGVPCPGCGMTRAAFNLLLGNFAASFYYHPLFFAAVLTAVYIAVRYIKYDNRPMQTREKTALIGLTAVFGAVYAARMIMYFPHTEPMVPNPTPLWRVLWQILQQVKFLFPS